MQGAHTLGFNTQGYGICFLGDFTAHNPSQPARAAYTSLVNCALEMGKIAGDFQMFGHRQTKPEGGTECDCIPLWCTTPGSSLKLLMNCCKTWLPSCPKGRGGGGEE